MGMSHSRVYFGLHIPDTIRAPNSEVLVPCSAQQLSFPLIPSDQMLHSCLGTNRHWEPRATGDDFCTAAIKVPSKADEIGVVTCKHHSISLEIQVGDSGLWQDCFAKSNGYALVVVASMH